MLLVWTKDNLTHTALLLLCYQRKYLMGFSFLVHRVFRKCQKVFTRVQDAHGRKDTH